MADTDKNGYFPERRRHAIVLLIGVLSVAVSPLFTASRVAGKAAHSSPTPGSPATASPTPVSAVAASVSAEDSAAFSPDEQRLMRLINQERGRHRLRPLLFDALLGQVAREHSRDMAARNYFDHHTPRVSSNGGNSSTTALTRYEAAYRRAYQKIHPSQEPPQPLYLCVAENLYYCNRPGPEKAHTDLCNSPAHHENMLQNDLQRVGVGTFTNSKGEYWVTQVFLARQDIAP